MNRLLSGTILILIGTTVGYLGKNQLDALMHMVGFHGSMQMSETSSSEKKILYWVAPMDANYRRDEPGQSPMGMDLVPVYEGDGSEEDGVVKISPTVANNLGVRTGEVESGILSQDIDTVGYVSFDEEKIYHVHTRVEGWVEKLLVKTEGERVKKGQKLFEIYSPALVNAQEEYLSALRSKNNSLISASEKRLRLLGVEKRQIDRLQKTRKISQRVDYLAAQSGFIYSLNIREGMFVKPATDVLSIGQLDTVWVIAEVFEQQGGWINEGQKVDMQVSALAGRKWQGVVDYIYPVLEASTRTLRVRVRFDNPDVELKPNMYANLTIRSTTGAETLFIPREAVIRSGKLDRVVKSLGDGKFQSVRVTTGIESNNGVEILTGLENGERVVTSAQFLIDSESSITADLGRMEGSMADGMEQAPANEVWVEGAITALMPERSAMTVEHQPVDEWGWPDMVMNFNVSKTIDLTSYAAGTPVSMLVKKLESGGIEVIEIKTTEDDDSSVWINGKVAQVMAQKQMMKIDHPPVDEWGWPKMVMDFQVADSVPIIHFNSGDEIRFKVKRLEEGGIQVVDIEDERLAWIGGKVNQVIAAENKINMDHGPVDAWGWPDMTMNFPVSEQINLDEVKPGDSIEALVFKSGAGPIQIIQLKSE